MQKLLLIDNIESRIDYELELRGFSRQTKESYIFHVRKFLDFIKKPARQATLTDVRRYIIALKDQNKRPATINLSISAIKFLYIQIWNRKSFNAIRSLKKEYRVPAVVEKHDIEKMIQATSNIKHKLLIELLYGSGVRVSEAVKLKLEDIRDDIALIRQSKGRKDRYVKLSQRFLQRLKIHLERRQMIGITSPYIFERRNTHITIRTAEAIIKRTAKKADIEYRVFPHALRSSYATHLFEDNTPEFMIQKLLGHRDLRTTQIYTRTGLKDIRNITSPLDR